MTDCSSSQCSLDFRNVLHRAPALGNETALGHVQVEHVHSMIDGLHLTHLLRQEREGEGEGERGRERDKGTRGDI